MSQDFTRSPSQAFVRSLSQAKLRMLGILRTGLSVSVFPFQGFGRRFDPSSWFGYQGDWNGLVSSVPDLINDGFGKRPGLSYLVYQNTPNDLVYRTLTSRLDYSDGTWATLAWTCRNYWVNGYGASTFFILQSQESSPPPTIVPNVFAYSKDGGPVSVSDTVVSQTIAFTYPGITSIKVSAILSDPLNYSDVIDASISALDSIPYRSIPSTGQVVDVIWPSASGLGNQTTFNTNFSYWIGAARGMMTVPNGSALNGESISLNGFNLGLSSRAIICAKSVNNGIGRGLFLHPLDSLFAPQPVINLAAKLPNIKLTPSTNPSLTPSGNFIPPNPLSGPYAPPYNPGGLGELGFQSTLT